MIFEIYRIRNSSIRSKELFYTVFPQKKLPPVCQPEKKVKAKSFSKISLCCSMLLKSIQTYFRQNGNLFLSQEINKIALTTQLFFSKSSQGFRSIFSQVTSYGAPPEVFVFGLCQLYNETKRPGFLDLLILFMDFSFTNTKYD